MIQKNFRTIIWGAAVMASTFMIGGQVYAASIVEGPTVRWNFSTWGKSRGMTAGIEKLSEQVKERTGGKFTIKVNYGAALSKSKENLDGIKIGAFQAAHFCNFYHPGKNPSFMVFSMPFLPIADAKINVAVRDALYAHPALIKDMDRWGAMTYMSTYLPKMELMGRGKPPERLEDWKGMRVRAGGGIGAAMEILGAKRTTMPAPEVYTAVQRRMVDAVAMPYTYALASFKISEVADWFTTNFNPGTADCPIIFNKSAYAKLPDAYKKLLDDVRSVVRDAQLTAYSDHDKVNVPAFKAKLKELRYSDAQLEEFRKVAGVPVWKEWVAKNKDKFDAQGLIDLIFKTAANAN